MSTLKPVSPQDFSEIRWRGHWVWVPEEQPKVTSMFGGEPAGGRPESHGLFRKTFHLDRVPERAPARITADSRYVLFVNGHEVFRGPSRSQPRRQMYDLFDLAPYLKTGDNVIAVHVKYFGTTKSAWMPAVPNGTLGKTGVLAFEVDLGSQWLVSDETWKARKSDAWSAEFDPDAVFVTAGVPVEFFDASKAAPNWHAAKFDDGDWSRANVIRAVYLGTNGHSQPPTDPYGPLFPRTIAKLEGARVLPTRITLEQVQAAPNLTTQNPAQRVEDSALNHAAASSQHAAALPAEVVIPANGHARIVIDMGRIVAGFVQFSMRAPVGTVLDFGYVEDPIKSRSFFGAHGGSRYIARGENDEHGVFDPKGFRYAYVLIHGSASSVTLNNFAVQEYLYPWQAGASFECSDAALNRLYRAGIRTVQLNSWDSFIDCPTREQRSWVGDSVVHQMVHLATNADWRLAWHYLALGNSPRPDGILPMSVAGDVEFNAGFTIPDWSLHWVHGVYNLYCFAGDADKVKEFMPTIERVLRWYVPFQTQSGVLKDVVEWNLVDWSSLYTEDHSAILTAHWARSLREFAEMAAWLGENASQRWAEKLYTKAKSGFDIFWDEARGTYVDHVKDGVQQRAINQLAGALAIVSGLARAQRWPRIINAITDAKKLVVRSWAAGIGNPNATPEEMQARMAQQMQGIYEADWDVENEIVISEPFMSYVVHDAVAQAGMADHLPELYTRWLDFLVDGFDTIGENWGTGTHVHGWSCTPTKDLIFYTLGVTPAEPGYAKARIAPRLGRLAWAKGSVPTPHGLISVEANADSVTIDSPVPIVLDIAGQAPRSFPAGKHTHAIHP